MPLQERLSQVVSLNLIGLVLYLIIDLPVQRLNITILDYSLIVTVSLQFLVVIVLAGLTFSGVGIVLNPQPYQWLREIHPFWINPTLLIILAALTLVHVGTVFYWLIGLVLTGGLLWLSLLAAYHQAQESLVTRRTFSPRKTQQSTLSVKYIRWCSEWIAYTLLLGFTLLMLQTQFSVTTRIVTLMIVSFLLAQIIFITPQSSNRRSVIYAAVIGWSIGQFVVVLQLFPLSGLQAGIVTSLCFYSLCGLVLTHFRERLTRGVIIEYGIIALLGGLIVLLIN